MTWLLRFHLPQIRNRGRYVILFSTETHNLSKQWKNYGKKMYLKRFGEDDWNKYSATQFNVQDADFKSGILNSMHLFRYCQDTAAKFMAKAAKDKDRGKYCPLSPRNFVSATHAHGVGASGTITIVDNPKFPEHDFFVAKKTFPVRVRHATLGSDDDATMVEGKHIFT